jgi:DNA replication protein DnaC
MARKSTRRKPAKTPQQELIQLALDLDLTATAAKLPKLLADAEKTSPSFTDFALSLLRVEADSRIERRRTRNLKRSRLGKVQGIEGFNFATRPQLDPRVVKELLTCRFVEEHRNVLCLGRPGLGKTRIAKALAHAACLAGHTVLCVVASTMLEDIHSSRVDGASFKRVLRRYTKPDLLLVDEFGYEAVTAAATDYLFRLVSARHENGSIVLTANRGFSSWKKLFPTATTAAATADRLVDGATILRFTGKSSRQPREVVGAPLEDDSDA